ncbi:MAG TPA: hypothetical protein VFC47_07195 [Caulobacteraceae bacterium]|nr:hypothetical protein [Caulobacteraceae bacterium]
MADDRDSDDDGAAAAEAWGAELRRPKPSSSAAPGGRAAFSHTGKPPTSPREARLAAALRVNLRRRKAPATPGQ